MKSKQGRTLVQKNITSLKTAQVLGLIKVITSPEITTEKGLFVEAEGAGELPHLKKQSLTPDLKLQIRIPVLNQKTGGHAKVLVTVLLPTGLTTPTSRHQPLVQTVVKTDIGDVIAQNLWLSNVISVVLSTCTTKIVPSAIPNNQL